VLSVYSDEKLKLPFFYVKPLFKGSSLLQRFPSLLLLLVDFFYVTIFFHVGGIFYLQGKIPPGVLRSNSPDQQWTCYQNAERPFKPSLAHVLFFFLSKWKGPLQSSPSPPRQTWSLKKNAKPPFFSGGVAIFWLVMRPHLPPRSLLGPSVVDFFSSFLPPSEFDFL